MLFDSYFIKQKSLAVHPPDSRMLSAAKAISWRIVGTIDTMVISYLITGEMVLAISIGGIEVVSKLLLYYFHERLWEYLKLRFSGGE